MHDAAAPALCLQVDQLLQPHFAEDMARLTVHCGKRAPRGRQTVVVSATLTAQVTGAAQAGSTPGQAVRLPASQPVGHCISVLFLSCCRAIWDLSILRLHSSAAAGLAWIARSWLQMLQETQHWCPSPERIFVKSDGSAATADELDAAAARMQSNAEAGPSGEAAAPQGQHTRLARHPVGMLGHQHPSAGCSGIGLSALHSSLGLACGHLAP